MHTRITQWFPVLALGGSVLAFWQAHWFNQQAGLIIPLLTLIMFCMGLTLSLSDFKQVLRRKRLVAIGLALQFSIMPLAAWLLASLFKLEADLVVGMVLLGAASGGTASNVICYLARADVALSITLTCCSTLLASFATPFLTWLYAGQIVPVPAVPMMLSVFNIVLVPVLLGLLLRHFAKPAIAKVNPSLPLITVLAIVWIITIIVALNHARLIDLSVLLIAVVILHNAFGLTLGYWAAIKSGCNQAQARTIAIEVGMQNSGLAVALAIKYFNSLTALPGALFSIWHNLSGSALASYWQKQDQYTDSQN